MKEISHPLATLLEGRKLVLGSRSPRRVQLLEELGLTFSCRPSDAPEDHDEETSVKEVPSLLASRKAEYLQPNLASEEVLITADTIVILDDEIIEKPRNMAEAKQFLHQLSGRWHTVITGFCLTSQEKQVCESVESSIRFETLEEAEVNYYLSRYEVLDKAGAYGVQDWIGLIGVAEIRGSYHNVMGLPTARIYHCLKEFLSTT